MRVVSEVTGVSEPDPSGPLVPVVSGMITALVMDAPELSDTEAVGPTMEPDPEAIADETIALETELASATGQTV